MCSILGILDIKGNPEDLRTEALELSRRQRHRGPDWSGVYVGGTAVIAHERLAIVDVENGAQPLVSPDGNVILGVNGEIYNHRAIRRRHQKEHAYAYRTASDCEVILSLYQHHGDAFLDELNGIFAFVLYDAAKDRWLIGRDPIGVVPLYYGYDGEERLYVASELKALVSVCETVKEFPAGAYWTSEMTAPEPYYRRDWMEFATVKDNASDAEALKNALEMAVKRQLMSDVPYGVLLSGGLDSSIVAAVAQKFSARRIEDDDKSDAWWPRLHSFAVGLVGSPDLAAARVASQHIGTVHHEFTYTIQEGIDALADVIYHVETYDVTTIRASTPMFLMARKIRALGIKMVLSGEGSDEIFGGYLYFHKAPNAQEFHEETVRKLKALSQFDCARANKSMAAWGVEARVPFLDKEFLDVAMRLNPRDKMCGGERMEKHILRDAFASYLPKSIAWRQKEQFSDGVGYGWIDSLKAHAEKLVSSEQLARAALRFPVNPPQTKEAHMYREIFAKSFPLASAAHCVPGGPSVACSTAKALEWDEQFKTCVDPSGRAVKSVHNAAYK